MHIGLLLFYVFAQLSLLIPGYSLLKRTKAFNSLPGIQLSLAYVVTILLYAVLATLTYVCKLNPIYSQIISWSALGLGLFIFVKNKYYKDLVRLRFPLVCLALMSVFSLVFISLDYHKPFSYIPDPENLANRNYTTLNIKVLNVAQTQANDNYVPYRQAQFFINRSDPAKDSFIGEWGVTFFERTPLMGALTANYLTMFNEKVPINYTWSADSVDSSHTYAQFQILAQILNALIIIPGFFIIEKLFNRKTAALSLLFFIPSQYFIYNAFFSWPKSLVSFFILISWLLLLEKRKRYVLAAGVVSGIAYLTHDLAVLYIAGSVMLLLFNKRFKDILLLLIPTGIIALPWIVTSSLIYKKPSTFIYYPLSTGGIPQPEVDKNLVHNFFHTSIFRLIKIRIDNLVYLLSPYELLSSEGGHPANARIWASGLFSIPGALGLGLIVPAYLEFIKRIKELNAWIFIVSPVLMSALVIGWPKGLGALHFAEAVVVIWSGFAIHYLTRLKSKLWLYSAFLINVAQLVFFTIYSFNYSEHYWVHSKIELFKILVLVSLTSICGWLVYVAANRPKNGLLFSDV